MQEVLVKRNFLDELLRRTLKRKLLETSNFLRTVLCVNYNCKWFYLQHESATDTALSCDGVDPELSWELRTPCTTFPIRRFLIGKSISLEINSFVLIFLFDVYFKENSHEITEDF